MLFRFEKEERRKNEDRKWEREGSKEGREKEREREREREIAKVVEKLMSSGDEQPPEGERYCSLAGWILWLHLFLLFLYPADHEYEEKDKKITGANTRAETNPSSNGPTRMDKNLSPLF